MAEINRLIGMLQVSAAQLSAKGSQIQYDKQFCNNHHSLYVPQEALFSVPEGPPEPYLSGPITKPDDSLLSVKPIPSSLFEAFGLVADGVALPPQPTETLSENFKIGLNHVLSTIEFILPPSSGLPASFSAAKVAARDLANDLAVLNCKRIFAASENFDELEAIANELCIPNTDKMAGRFPVISTSNLPAASPAETSATASPARGTAMLNSIFKSVRVPEFRFKWQFWAEKGQQTSSSTKPAESEDFASRPKPLGDQIITIKEFYQHFNNIPTDSLKLRDSIHLFHLGVKPLWEDPRNTRGGAFYFRIGKEVAAQFWHEICLLAVGDVLQSAVETKREAFNDDICGITYSVRWNAVQIAIWNRDADNEAGKEKLLATILEKLSDELKPKKDSYWYKAHKEHKGFIAPST